MNTTVWAKRSLAAAALMGAMSAQAATVIDFDTDSAGNTLAAGTAITNQYAADGVTFYQIDTYIQGSTTELSDLMVFDSANPTGGDSDLATPGYHPTNTVGLGNVLIISEDNDASDPDDQANGGRFYVELDPSKQYKVDTVTFLDIEDKRAKGEARTQNNSTFFALFDSSQTQIGSNYWVTGLGDNSVETLNVDVSGAQYMYFSFHTSGALAGFELTSEAVAASEPAALALMSLGLAGLMITRRRNRSLEQQRH